MSRPLSRRSGAVDPFIVMDVMAAAAEKEAAGDTVIHLEVGQPSTPAPKGALAAAHAALDSERIGYVAALGIPALRERIARHYREQYGSEISAERVVVTTGSSGGFPLAFLASFDAGDRIALAAPGYPAYRNARDFLSEDKPEKPGCLVLDVHLPGLTGLDLQKELIGTERALPIIFLTGMGDIPMSVSAMTRPPNSPITSARIVRSGSAMISAPTRGTTSFLTGLAASTRNASTCSVTVIDPSSAVIPAPTRPATMRAVSTGPSSRTMASAKRFPTNDSPP